MPKILNEPKENMLFEVKNLLSQGGYNAVTVRAVAQGCGVGVGTVYNYFPSKEALVAEYLLADWRQCIRDIEQLARSAVDVEPVARCIHEQLLSYLDSHKAIFQDESAYGTYAASFGQYHGLLRSQLASPLRDFCTSDFMALFAAEALLTWTMAGREFYEIWALLSPSIRQ